MTMFKFCVEEGEQRGSVFALREGENLLGRSHKAQIRLRAPDVSGEHAQITVQGQAVTLRNLSSQGTWVEGERLKGAGETPLRAGQKIRVGKHTVLRLSEEGEESAALPARATEQETSGSATTPFQPTRSTLAPETTAEPVSITARNTPTGIPTDFESLMREKVQLTHWDDSTGEPDEDKTHVQKTRVADPAEIDRLTQQELWRQRRRITLILGPILAGLVALIVFWPSATPPKPLEWDQSYVDGTLEMSTNAGYRLVFPQIEKTKVKPDGNGAIFLPLGPKRDVMLTILTQEDIADRWALQETERTMQEWIRSNPDYNCGPPVSWFGGKQNGVRIWSASYTRTNPKGEKFAGRVNLWCSGGQRVVQKVELAQAQMGRAEQFLYYLYFEFPEKFEEEHWEGQAPSPGISLDLLLTQSRADLQREAPLTWANVGKQLRRLLVQAVADHRSETGEEALKLLAKLRGHERLWYSGQSLQMTNASSFRDDKLIKEIAQRCQAVFSDPADRRYSEVRKWR